MAVFDTTNARIAFVVPPSGMVRVVIQVTVHGAATFSQYILGCLEGATVRGRVMPVGSQNGTALATTMMSQSVDYVVTGLTPAASLTWDAAWGCEQFVTNSLLKYGGPNNTTANDNFGALIFQIWDPCPIYTPTSATAPATTVSARVDSVKTKTDFLPSATAGAAGGLFIAGTNAATTITTALTTTFTGNLTGSVASVTGLTASNLDATISSRMATYTQPTGFLAATFPNGTIANTTNITAGTIATVTNLTNAPTAGDFTATMKTSIGTAVAASAVASVTGNVGGNVSGSVASVTAAVSVTGDLSATMKTSVTTAATAATPTAAAVTGNVGGNVTGSVGSVVGLTASNLDATVSSRLATAGYTVPDNVSVAAIKVQTDKLTFTVANKLDANSLYINGVQVQGLGLAPPDHWHG